ncbi:MAG: hypothetical protein IJQ39_04875 [Thermoguttaceae bacterium]|nr:hypothetical protein [Thermoguttaceae bacterium]
MSENNNEPFKYVPPEIDLRSLELQLQPEEPDSKEDEETDPITNNCRLWANLRLFVLPGCVRIEQKNQKISDVLGENNLDYLTPKTKLGRQLGVMQYILYEEGNIVIEEMLYIDVILRRINQFSPFMPGVDRYDDRGIMHLFQGMQKFLWDFFSLTPQKRKDVIDNFELIGKFSPEILQALNHLKKLVNLPRYKTSNNSPQNNPVHYWPTDLNGRDLELFKLLSGMETVSPRKQALSVLNYILPEDPETSKRNDSDSSDSAASESQTATIRMEPVDKERIARLLKRFPALNHCNPYLIKMVENEIPFEKFSAKSDGMEHFYNGLAPSRVFFPSVLADPPKEPGKQNRFSSWIYWGVMVAVVCSLTKLAGILIHALIK